MNKAIGWGLFGLLCLLPSKAKASTWSDVFTSFTNETQITFLSKAFTAYGLDTNNGATDVINGVEVAEVSFLSVDTGLVNPDAASKTGTPLLGISLHFDRLLNTVFPSAIPWVKNAAPTTANNFLSLLFVGAAPIYNWNAQSNQKALMIEVYGGLEFKIGS